MGARVCVGASMSANPTVALGQAFDDLWSGDDVVIDERRTVRADGELVGQLRLPDEFLPVAAGEMFP